MKHRMRLAPTLRLDIAYSAEGWVERFGNSRKRTVVTIGNFDGVHLGHQKILNGVVERARANDLESAVLTFYPHPARVLRPDAAPTLLMTLEQRLAAFDAMGINASLVLRFDAELAKISAEDFAKTFLVDSLRAKTVLVGENFRFGNRQGGDVNLLQEIGRRSDFEVVIVPPVVENGVIVSSTAVREALRDGRVADAEPLLGRPFSLKGEIRPGTGKGRELVVPTLNLATEQETLPKNGVYATATVVGPKIYWSVTNIGVRPTFNGRNLAIESHLFDFAEQLTSGKMEVIFLKRLRDERKFSDPEALREQVLKDIEQARSVVIANQ
ncbi:MAG: bifunctional riboflavin kinase/FAD synthetase [Candidatus Acidiferrales bacterium]